jgi:hypothetical protein
VGGWDGYYARVAVDEGVKAVSTVDDDLERFDAFETEVALSAEEFDELNRFLGRRLGDRVWRVRRSDPGL